VFIDKIENCKLKMKKNIVIKGNKVHNIGYRLFLMETADELGIENFYVKNIKEDGKEGVFILVESKETKVEEFIKFIKENFPSNADVSTIDVKEYTGDVRSLEAFRASFDSSQLAKLAMAGVEMLKKQDAMLGKQDAMLGKQDAMLGKQDTTIGLLIDIKKDTSDIKRDVHDIKQDTKHIPVLLSEIQDMKIKYNKLESDVIKIKKVLKISE